MNSRQSTNVKTIPSHQFTDLRVVLTKYLYHWPLFALGLIIAIVGAYIYLHNVNPVYEISATILVKDEKKSPQEDKAALPELNQTSSPKNAETEIEILKSKNLINQVVNNLQLWVNYKSDNGLKTQDLYESSPVKFLLVQKAGSLSDQKINILVKDKNTFVFNNASGQKQTAAFNKPIRNGFGTWLLKPTDFTDQYIGSNITIELNDPQKVSNNYVKAIDAHLLDKLAPTIGLSISDEVPKRGVDFLDTLIMAYNQAALMEEKRTTKSTIDFIDNRLASLTGELSHAEKNVEGYRSSQGITDISSQSQVYLENVQNNGIKLNEVNVQLNVINGIERYVNSPNDSGTAPATIGITDPALNSLIEKLSDLQLKRSALLATTPEGNPMFEPINKQIALTKASIRQTVQGIKASLLSSKKELQSFNSKSQSSIKDIPGQERQFVDMKRQQSIKENLYVYLLQKREELALSYASTFVDARVVDKANVGDVTWPKKSFVFAIALLCGLGIPFMIIYFRNSLTNKITERRDIENALDIPVLGELSYEDLNDDVIVVTNKHHLIGEQFRALRTNLHYAHTNLTTPLNLSKASLNLVADQDLNVEGRVTLLTSSISKEGKSFVSVNLAVSLAATGRKTVILEMDLRKPKILKIFNLQNDKPGISEFLSSGISVDSIINPSGKIANLDIIGCGQIPIDPSELLENERLVELISELKDRYDDIIIDTPPLHLVTDAMIIAKLADVSLYIIRQGYTGKNELDFISEIEQTEKLPNMQIVFNGIKKSKYGYGYNYDNSYYNIEPAKPTFNIAWKKFLSRF
ncbi:GumC family protein [Mucilaginibacter jinjuensis]|uniref:non-specific protein-tyrosine kinase n=1 Tax=Mucilaginibacter jinjuensis TaxID=1176721 RepID=A0ABY7T4U4_9SPHI|nr:polysaccharide biosynthesis tyrosine autokinase [Mucilaginibacter jinjuensis]WCT10722.1 polysaccharide biosynthesis tyrosine autokinase [Mucilaginibacter jinjuensis]